VTGRAERALDAAGAPRQLFVMVRALRLMLAVCMLLSLGVSGGLQPVAAAAMDMHRLADCPHAMAGDDSEPMGPHHRAAPMPPCCHAPTAIGLPSMRLGLVRPAPGGRPEPRSERLPVGNSPGPELPPPRA